MYSVGKRPIVKLMHRPVVDIRRKSFDSFVVGAAARVSLEICKHKVCRGYNNGLMQWDRETATVLTAKALMPISSKLLVKLT